MVTPQLAHLEAFRVHLPDQVEIDETVVHRRHQRIRPRRHIFGEAIVAPGRIDDQKIHPLGQRVHLLLQLRQNIAFMHGIFGGGQAYLPPPRGFLPIFEVARDGPLPGIEVEHRHLVPLHGERHGDMHRRCGLSRAALFIGENNVVRLSVRHDPASSPDTIRDLDPYPMSLHSNPSRHGPPLSEP